MSISVSLGDAVMSRLENPFPGWWGTVEEAALRQRSWRQCDRGTGASAIEHFETEELPEMLSQS